MMKWWRMFTRNHKGFSLVELICAVAILSIVITGAGSAMVISARSYQRGSVELDLQQQAQITANLLTNIIIDADTIEEPALGASGTVLSVRKIETDAEGNESLYRYRVTTGSTNPEDPTYRQLLYTREKIDDDGYVLVDGDGNRLTKTNILAEHIDASAFEVTRVAKNNIDFTLKVLSEDGRTFESDYHVTPRNGVSGETGSTLDGEKRIWVENELVLEPNQDYYLSVRITGTSTQGYKYETEGTRRYIPTTGSTSSETEVTYDDDNTIKIKVGKTETGSGTEGMFSFNVEPKDTDIDPINVKVYVRRVNDINVTGTRTSGSVNKAGGYYKVTAPLSVTNAEKRLGEWYDADYVNPYQITWSYGFTKQDEDGNVTHPDYNEYIEIIGSPGIDENNIPYVIFKLKQDMTSGCELTVTATALHPEGAKLQETPTEVWSNKSKQRYGKVDDVTGSVCGSWTLKYQAWRRNGKLDITVPITDRDYDFYPDGSCLYKYRDDAHVRFIGYDINNNVIVDQDYNPWTSSQNSLLNANIDKAQVDKVWDLILNVTTDSGDRYYGYSSYSTPYFVAGITDQFGNATNPYSWSDVNISGNYIDSQYRYGYGGFGRTDVARYVVEVTYGYEDESGVKHVETVTSEQTVENVSIQYRNSLLSPWTKRNPIYVTTDDQITDYKVYFKFDKGWDGRDYYFHDLERFVGVVHDDDDDMKDQRRDIVVIQDPILMTASHPQTDESTYITFHLDAADKEECKRLSEDYGGVITEVYEYNPFLDMLNKKETQGELIQDWYIDENGWHPAVYETLYEIVYPSYDGMGITTTHDMLQKIKGCSGVVEFHFVDPNITGTTLKTMYCPTLAEYGPLYYIDDTSRFSIQATTAQYQELVGGTWTTVVNLTWNGSGWTAS